MTYLVTGATGTVGSRVTQRLIDRGDRPAVFVRDPKRARRLDIWRAIRQGRLATVTDGVQQVLGRKPASFDQWVVENEAAFRQSGTRRGS
ncbi:MAG: hypothetical protein KC766_00160 [Myxococcales bacterium]|nr:hypothetical protein [Myxococcales bacterium]